MSYLSNANGQWQVVLSIPYITLKANSQKPKAIRWGDRRS